MQYKLIHILWTRKLFVVSIKPSKTTPDSANGRSHCWILSMLGWAFLKCWDFGSTHLKVLSKKATFSILNSSPHRIINFQFCISSFLVLESTTRSERERVREREQERTLQHTKVWQKTKVQVAYIVYSKFAKPTFQGTNLSTISHQLFVVAIQYLITFLLLFILNCPDISNELSANTMWRCRVD